MKVALFIVKAAVIAILGIFAVAVGLVFSQQPDTENGGKTLDFATALPPSDVETSLKTYKAEDGANLGYRYFPANQDNAPLVILIHGSGWHGGGYQWLAKRINGNGDIAVAVPDLRGHGPSPIRRGDVDYIGQLEDDIASLAQKLLKPGQKLILAGHSSGGGLVIRFAGGKHGDMLDGAVLLSPYLKYDAPTMRDNSGGWANPLTRRIIGLSILNAFGITAFNGLTVVTFNFPKSVLESAEGAAATTHYSYRLNVSYAPRNDYRADIAKLPRFLLVAGRRDEAFRADQFEPVLSSANDKGTYRLLDGVNHLQVVNVPETAKLIRDFVLKTRQDE